jgi:hypothetical protein
MRTGRGPTRIPHRRRPRPLPAAARERATAFMRSASEGIERWWQSAPCEQVGVKEGDDPRDAFAGHAQHLKRVRPMK